MEIIRTIVESVDAPENRYNYWLDLRTLTLKRWNNDEWIPISVSVTVNPSDVTAVTLIEDKTPTKSVAVDNEPTVKIKGSPSGAIANVQPDGSLDVFIKNQALDVHIIDGQQEGPQKVEVTNNYLQTEIHNSEDNPIIVKMDTTEGPNEVKVLNTQEESVKVGNDSNNPLYIANSSDNPIDVHVSNEEPLKIDLPESITVSEVEKPVTVTPYGSNSFQVSIENVGTVRGPSQSASLNVNVTNNALKVNVDNSSLLQDIKKNTDDVENALATIEEKLGSTIDVNLGAQRIKIDDTTPIDINIPSIGTVPVEMTNEVSAVISDDQYQIDNTMIPVGVWVDRETKAPIDVPVWVLKSLSSGSYDDFESIFFSYMYGHIAQYLNNTGNKRVFTFHIPCGKIKLNNKEMQLNPPYTVILKDVHIVQEDEAGKEAISYPTGSVMGYLTQFNDTGEALMPVGINIFYPYYPSK